jgi:hypothetical protein
MEEVPNKDKLVTVKKKNRKKKNRNKSKKRAGK